MVYEIEVHSATGSAAPFHCGDGRGIPTSEPIREVVLERHRGALTLADQDDQEDDLTSMDAAARANMPRLRHDAPLGDRDLNAILDEVRSVRLQPRSDRQIRGFAAAHCALPDPDGRMLTVTRKSVGMLWNSVGTLLEAIPDLRSSRPNDVPVVDVRLSVGSTPVEAGTCMLEALGAIAPGGNEYEIWRKVRKLLCERNTRVVHWDLDGPADLARGRWIERMEFIVLNCVLAERTGRLFVCTGPWSPERLFPGVRLLRESATLVDQAESYEAVELTAGAIEEMAARAGLTVEADLRGEVVPCILAGSRSIKAHLRRGVSAVTRALAPEDEAGDRIPPSRVLSAYHFGAARRQAPDLPGSMSEG